FQRYVSPAVIEHILADPGKLGLGGEKRRMSFVFSDLAGFTTLTERHEPEVVVALLQAYFDGMLQIALGHGGTVDRLVGDSIAVFFGAPAEQPDHAARAVRCALEIDRYCEAFRAAQTVRGIEMGVTRIGVHSGTAIVGNVGSAERLHYTAHGDCVNAAARLESANKQLGTRVCISAEAARHCTDGSFRPVADLVLKGKSESLECVAPWDGLCDDAREDYLAAYAALQRGDAASLALFAALHRRVPDDGLVAYHYRRLAGGAQGARIVLEEK
ncbi:MAG TPA: adenylate/guanylate cyclase domain-containing protein, partial [Gammaproteobacteria bacterium]|nr:adenylate/guanylate cyclase domain-containing protein [Gammaproteobacteria bacterium]